MNTKWKVIVSIMLLICIICAVFIYIVQREHDEKIAEIIEGKSESATLVAETILSQILKGYQRRIISFSNPSASFDREIMIQAFAQRDRKKLLQLSKLFTSALEKEDPYFKTIGWILPDNHVFLRMIYPEKFGDDISKLRPDIVAVNRDKKQHSGFDVGIKSMQYRIVQPVFYHGEYLGAVQFGISAHIIMDALQSRLQTISGMAVINEAYDFTQKSQIPKIKFRTHTIRTHDVSIFEPIQDQLDWNKKQQRVMLNGRLHAIIDVLPVKDFQNKDLGFFFVTMDISEELAQKRKLLFTVLIISSVILFISFIILYFSYGALVQKIIVLNRSLKKSNLELESRVHERTAKLKKSEKRYQTVVDTQTELICRWKSDGILTFVNEAYCRFFLKEKSQLIGKSFFAFIPKEDHEIVTKHFSSLTLQQPVSTHEHRVISPSGDIHWMIWTNMAIFDDQGRLIEMQDVGRDITARKLAEERVEEMQGQLIQADKMAALGQLVAGVAHEVNNSINFISGALPSLSRNIEKLKAHLQQKQTDSHANEAGTADLTEVLEQTDILLENINHGAKRAGRIVDDLRSFSSPKIEKDVVTDVHTILDSILVLLRSQYGANTEIIKDYSAENSKILCSPNHLSQVFMNIMLNGVQAISGDGVITILTKNNLGTIVIGFRDNGCGIPPETKNKIFEPFFSTKDIGEGTGLGLSISYNIVKNLQGEILVESVVGKGTEFTIVLPCAYPHS